MFERRLRHVLILFAAATAVILARLAAMQVVRHDQYLERTEDMLVRPPERLPFVRGGIFDRRGEPLVTDEPRWQIAVDYRALAPESEPLSRHIRAYDLKRRYGTSDPEKIRTAYDRERARAEREIAEFEGTALDEIVRRRREIVERVARIREAHAERIGYDEDVREQTWAHALVSGLTIDQQVTARERLAAYPWVRVRPSSERTFHDAFAFAHVLGRVGPVSAEDVRGDPGSTDRLARYVSGDVIGRSGVERVCEAQLRGRRGEVTRDRRGEVVEGGLIESRNGADVRLTIHGDLQRRLYDVLERAVAQHADVPGGSIVVVDVTTREVLACVSCPSYAPARFSEEYTRLQDDTERLPLIFRAVSMQTAPGSIVKPLTCLAGLASGRVGLDDRFECSGYLFPENPEAGASKCWQIDGSGPRMRHGAVDVVAALRGSCNIYMYRLGERLGAGELCLWFDRAGLGRGSGLGFAEELPGVNPTADWMYRRGIALTAAHPRFFAIGQGELCVTPVQAANLAACYASGEYRPVRIVSGAPLPRRDTLPATSDQLRAIRQGMYEVVNHPEGTAHKYVSFYDEDFVLCGKTGSATVKPRPTRYVFRSSDEVPAEILVSAGSLSDARERMRVRHPEVDLNAGELSAVEFFPRGAAAHGEHAHAWFIGFLQPRGAGEGPDWSRSSPVAFAVLLEFGGSGGRVSGPVAGEIARTVLEVLGPDLRTEAPR
ncbi:MAG: hypothetical protein BroJett003_18840 [Planctomycetota bacterium]|nr:MAG: hypothetical protein BroJett003_18840 [Planctomycetota bacterium]